MIKPIPDFPDYFADELGNIYSTKVHKRYKDKTKKLKMLTAKRNNRGYITVTLTIDGKEIGRRVHQLILETFVSPRPDGMLACHGVNGNKDNSLKNLYWGTPKQNTADRRRDGTASIGEKNPLAVLNELQVRVIRRTYKKQDYIVNQSNNSNHISFKYLSKLFNCSEKAIYSIVNRKTWTHI